MTRPGDRLRAFAVRWCCADTITRVVDPLVADLQHEHAQAVQGGRVWRSRAIRMAGWIAFAKVIAICTWRDELGPWNWAPDDRRTLMRACAFSIAVIVAIAVLMLVPTFITMRPRPLGMSLWLLLTLVPQALTIAVMAGALLGVVFAVGGRALSRRVAEGIVLLAVVASVLSFVNMSWVLPAANQSFRVTMAGRTDVPKGPPELTLAELGRAIEAGHQEATQPPASWSSFNLKTLEMQYHERWAFSFSPLALCVFAVAVAAVSQFKRWVLGIVAITAIVGYYALFYFGRSLVFAGTVPAYVYAWTPNVMFAALAGFLMIRRPGPSPWFYAAPR